MRVISLIRTRWLSAGASVAGGLLVLGLSFIARDSDWWSGTLVNAGTALLLFAPLLLVGRHIEHRFDQVEAGQAQIEAGQAQIEERQEAAAANIAALSEEFTQLRRTREELTEAVSARLSTRRDRDREILDTVESAPSCETIRAALSRAADLHLVSQPGCRVLIQNTGIFLWFEPPADERIEDESDIDEFLRLRLEHHDGSRIAELWWEAETSAEAFLVELADAVVRAGHYPGDRLFEAGRIFGDLRELLEVVYESATGGSFNTLSGAIQFCPPQWMVTDTGLVSVGDPGGYDIPASRIEDPQIRDDIAEKNWPDLPSFDAAITAGRALYKAGRLVERPPTFWDDPPF